MPKYLADASISIDPTNLSIFPSIDLKHHIGYQGRNIMPMDLRVFNKVPWGLRVRAQIALDMDSEWLAPAVQIAGVLVLFNLMLNCEIIITTDAEGRDGWLVRSQEKPFARKFIYVEVLWGYRGLSDL